MQKQKLLKLEFQLMSKLKGSEHFSSLGCPLPLKPDFPLDLAFAPGSTSVLPRTELEIYLQSLLWQLSSPSALTLNS